jgi:anti-sigma factor RsiW
VSASEPTVKEDELNAYIDGQLPSARLSAVTRYLATHPSEAKRIASYLAQRDALRAAFSTPEAESLPPELNFRRLLKARARRRLQWHVATAAALALIVGGAAGWFLHSSAPPSRVAHAMLALEEQAFAAHTVYTVDVGHLGAIPGSGNDTLAQWLSIHLNRKATLPDLSAAGYKLMGGWLLGSESGTASALLLYETSDGRRLSLLMRPMAPDLSSPEVELSRGTWNTCAWIAYGMGYALVAEAPRDELDRLSDQIRGEFQPG